MGDVKRIAVALERIADSLEQRTNFSEGAVPRGTVSAHLDAKELAQAVTSWTLRQAAGGHSTLVGGSIVVGREDARNRP